MPKRFIKELRIKNYTKLDSVSVIIPIYNVQEHIEKCVRSLLCQTYNNVEYIFIDDASTDSSIFILNNIIQEFPDLLNKILIVKHQYNQGLPSARNTGLQHAKGKYIFHCDSDDWVEKDMLEKMVLVAEKNKAEIVYSDWYLNFEKSQKYMKQPFCRNNLEAVQNMLNGSMKYNVWNKLILKKLYDDYDIRFPDGKSMGEDMTIIKLFSKAKNILYLDNAFYHYMQTNQSSLTKNYSQKNIDSVIWNTLDVIDYLTENFTNKNLFDDMQFFKLNVKLPFLISLQIYNYKLWRNTFLESNEFIWKNKKFSFRIKVVQLAAQYNLNFIVWMHAFFLNRIFYKI